MRAIRVTVRVLLGVAGGYAASAAVSGALAAALNDVAGFDRGASTVLCSALGFASYLFAALWALTAPSIVRVALLLTCSALGGYGIAHLYAPSAGAFSPFALPFG